LRGRDERCGARIGHDESYLFFDVFAAAVFQSLESDPVFAEGKRFLLRESAPTEFVSRLRKRFFVDLTESNEHF